MTNVKKEALQKAVVEKINLAGSQNKAATLLEISPAHLINVLKGNFDLVSEKKLVELSAKLNIQTGEWQVSKNTTSYRRVSKVCQHTQSEGLRQILIGRWGAGKSETLKGYRDTHPDVYLVECEEFWTMRTFLQELMIQLSISAYEGTMADMTQRIIKTLSSKPNALIIIDEAGELTDRAFKLIKALSNKTHVGIIVAGTPALKNKIEKRVEREKETYGEFFDRFGGRFLLVDPPSDKDIKEICSLNGVETPEGHIAVLKYARGLSYRVLKRVIKTYKFQTNGN